MTVFALLAGLVFSPVSVLSQTSDQTSLKVLAQAEGGLNLDAVQILLDQGDALVVKGKLSEARVKYDNARKTSILLLKFYRNLSGAFRGLNARIPREMDAKGRKAQNVLAEVNLRLAALFRLQDKPAMAVPLLVEVLQRLTPADPKGQKAYQRLLELGFVETPYVGAKR